VKANDLPAPAQQEAADLLSPLLNAPRAALADATSGVAVGELLALTEDARAPVVRCPAVLGDQGVIARSTVDLHGAHIGHAVVLAFEGGDASRPIVVGVLRDAPGWPLAEPAAQVEVDADGQRMVVSAKEQLVLRCGKASITLTKAGKVLIEGTHLSSRSTGSNRIKGGSIQLN
jgi:hypothetical protein